MGSVRALARIILSLMIVGLLALLPVSAGAEPLGNVGGAPPKTPPAQYIPGEIVVKFKGDAKPFRVVKLPPGGTVPGGIARHISRSDVVFAEPNYIYHALMVPNDQYYGFQWHMQNPAYGGIRTEAAWNTATGQNPVTGQRAVVAVVDTGVAYETYGGFVRAPDLACTTFVPGYDFYNNDTHPNDDQGHGTHVTGTIAQCTNNGIGVAGVAYNAAIMPIKVLGADGSGSDAGVAAGIRWAADNGAKVISLSLGGPAAQVMLDAVSYAYSRGVTVVAAAGNDMGGPVIYPAAYDCCVIAVSATTYSEQTAWYSNVGASVDISAPGGDLGMFYPFFSPDENNDGYADGVLQQTFAKDPADRPILTQFWYEFLQGTSMATPHVSGVAALLVGLGVGDPAAVRNTLQSTAEDHGPAGWDSSYGWGIVDAARAVGAASGVNAPPTANAGPDKSAQVGQTVSLDGSASQDIDGTIASYAWSFGDGTSYSESAASAPDGLFDGKTVHAYGAAGTYTITLTVTDNLEATGTDTALVTVTAVNPATLMHVESITVSAVKRSGKWQATGVVTIFNGSGASVSGATVNVSWSGAYTGTASKNTDSAGKVTFQSGRVSGSNLTFRLGVNSVTKTGSTYDSAANKETSDSVTTP